MQIQYHTGIRQCVRQIFVIAPKWRDGGRGQGNGFTRDFVQFRLSLRGRGSGSGHGRGYSNDDGTGHGKSETIPIMIKSNPNQV